jgi:hypothetical protein
MLASNVVNRVKLFNDRLTEKNKPNVVHFRCAGHLINLIVGKFFNHIKTREDMNDEDDNEMINSDNEVIKNGQSFIPDIICKNDAEVKYFDSKLIIIEHLKFLDFTMNRSIHQS